MLNRFEYVVRLIAGYVYRYTFNTIWLRVVRCLVARTTQCVFFFFFLDGGDSGGTYENKRPGRSEFVRESDVKRRITNVENRRTIGG